MTAVPSSKMERTVSSSPLLASDGTTPPPSQPSSRLVGSLRVSAFSLVLLYALFSSLLLWLGFGPRSSFCHVFRAQSQSETLLSSASQTGLMNVGLAEGLRDGQNHSVMITTMQTVSVMPIRTSGDGGQSQTAATSLQAEVQGEGWGSGGLIEPVITPSGQQQQQQQQQKQQQQQQGAASEPRDRLTSGQDAENFNPAHPPPAKFFLYRLLGNSLPPLQCDFQMYRNTLFALKHEPPLADCRRLWVLNHNVNATERGMLLDLLLAHGYSMEDIIVRRINFTRLTSLPRAQWRDAVSAQNEARNLILDHGRSLGARWILAFDGNQFFTTESWYALTSAADQYDKKGLKVFKVPMYRVYQPQSSSWLNATSSFTSLMPYAPFLWESQMAFRNDSTARYHEGLEYGRDNKLELMDRVCGTGRFTKTPRKLPNGTLDTRPADTGQCGCHREVGCDRRIRDAKPEVARKCGYAVRLWYFPCAGVDTTRLFQDNKYRASLRDKGRQWLENQIDNAVKKWTEGDVL